MNVVVKIFSQKIGRIPLLNHEMKIIIGTKNKAKVAAVETVMTNYFQNVSFELMDVASDVSEMPFSNEETRQGAINRAKHAISQSDGFAAFGLEGGVQQIGDVLYCVNWGAMALQDGTIITATGAGFELPEEIAQQLREGKELGPVMDTFTAKQNIRHHEGAIGIFTNGLIDRQKMFEHIVTILIGQLKYKMK
jgi:inosine/xanthosine triphosphatase